MANRITNYETLKQAIADFARRDDLDNYIDYYIQFAEQKILRDIFLENMGSGIKAMETPLAGAINAQGQLAAPADYLSLKEMQVIDEVGDILTLDYKDPQWIYVRYPQQQAQGIPAFVAREGSNFVFGPFPDALYTVQGIYYGSGGGLSVNNPTTWMVTSYPDLMLAACMVEAGPSLKDAAMLQMWQGQYTAKFAGLVAVEIADKLSGATLQMEIA